MSDVTARIFILMHCYFVVNRQKDFWND